MPTRPLVTGIFVHPIKSCRPRPVSRAAFDRFGLIGDRRFLIVDERGQFLTQRTVPELALIEATPLADGATLALSAPHAGRVVVPVADRRGPSTAVVVWHDTVHATDLGATAAEWLSGFLSRKVRLVNMAPDFDRPVRRTARPGDQVAFPDAFPLLVVSEASLSDLNQRLDFPVPMERFRPNIVVSGCDAYDEDRWTRVRIGDSVLRAAGACVRCVVTTTDQHTLQRSKEPLRTLATYRRRYDGGVFFGQNYIHETKSGTIAVGMALDIVDAGK